MSTHVEEGASVFQHQLAGVRFVLAVVHVDVELISLQEERRRQKREEEGVNMMIFMNFSLLPSVRCGDPPALTQVTKQ